MSNNRVLAAAKSYGRIPDVQPLPDLIEIQLQSYGHFVDITVGELFDEISPIRSFNGNIELHLDSCRFEEPKHSLDECRDMDLTYAAPLWVTVRLINRETGEIQTSEVFFGDFPAMTSGGTFIISGTERVIVSQLIRSPGVYFEIAEERTTGMILSQAKLIPDRGAWLEFETRKRGDLTVKVNRKRKIPVTIFLRALAAVDDGQNPGLLTEGSDRELSELFSEVDTMPDRSYIEATMRLEPAWEPKGERAIAQEALVGFFQLMRPGDPPTLDNAMEYLRSRFFDPRRYDLSQVGRYKLNYRLHLDTPLNVCVLTKADVVELVRHMIRINNGVAGPDDIDHLGNRRIRTVGELLRNQLRVGLLRMERVVRERMSIRDPEQMTPVSLINIRPFVAASREFFGSSQLSQFMEQINPLTELTNKRTLSALGPGGLNRRRAGFDVRDVHRSHYGRICPIETPEGPNIGLIGRLATYARINAYGFIETPYRRVKRRVPPVEEELAGRILSEDVVAPGDGQPVADAGTEVDEELARAIAACGLGREIGVIPYVTDEVEYLSADEEEQYTIAQVNAEIDERGQFVDERVSARRGEGFLFEHRDRIDYMDVSPKQIVGVSASLIPFLEHDDANRALMGANQQRQAVPLLRPEAPTVRTGVEVAAALGSGQVLLAEAPGEVISVTGRRVVVRERDGTERTYSLRKFNRSNQGTCIDQHPIVDKGDHVEEGDVLGDSSSTDHGRLALGQNVLMAFLSWKGGNYEDAILVSEELVRRDRYTSIHIVKHEVQARDTKLGPEEITRDIPNVGEEALRDLDQDGIIRIGAEVKPDDILVGKITPKGEKELTPEEKLLRAIFGEKAREVKDSSLRLPHGERGKVVDVKIFDRSDHPSLPTGVNQVVRVSIAQTRELTEGDKMAGRHGNKGVISKVVPVEDMPFLAGGTPVELILDPLGVPGRMNIGQILEAHLGWAADRMGFSAICPVFDGAREDEIAAELARAWLMDQAWREVGQQAWSWLADIAYDLELLRDDEEARLLCLSHWLSDEQCDKERLLHDRIYARRSALEAWLRELGYDPQELLVWEGDDRPRAGRDAADQKARELCLKLWLEEQGQDTSDLLDSESRSAAAVSYGRKRGVPMPTTGKVILYDGETGEPFDQPVTVGVINMMKLLHLVEDKIHARSTGPYSLVTQQPLGGKAQMGGQRFGEMEVWALEAYGAAHTLQEMLTVKSDDVTGRVQTYEAIIKGEAIQEPSIPESFRVLVKELQSLGLSIQVVAKNGELLQFGKEDQEEKVPTLGLDLRAPGFGWT